MKKFMFSNSRQDSEFSKCMILKAETSFNQPLKCVFKNRIFINYVLKSLFFQSICFETVELNEQLLGLSCIFLAFNYSFEPSH
jgi:hypothetical protein